MAKVSWEVLDNQSVITATGRWPKSDSNIHIPEKVCWEMVTAHAQSCLLPSTTAFCSWVAGLNGQEGARLQNIALVKELSII